MEETPVAVVVRQQAWFEAHVEVEGLPPFPGEQANSVSLRPIGVIRPRVLLGKGPLEHDLGLEVHPWFDHGQDAYPVLQCPSTGPRGAGLHATATPSRIVATEQQAVCLVEVSMVQPVREHLPAAYEAELQSQTDEQERTVPKPAVKLIEKFRAKAKRWLDQAVGLYALYQYPVVWKPLAECPLVAFVNVRDQKLRQMTPAPADNYIPFRLRVNDKIRDGQLADGALTGLHHLAAGDLHLPLVLLQRALWQRNVEVRFLESFWVIDLLVGRSKAVDDAEREARRAMYECIEQLVVGKCPEHHHRLRRLKGLLVQPSLKHRLASYLADLGVSRDSELIAEMVKLRNDLSHGVGVDAQVVAMMELETRSLVREIMRQELARKGVRFEEAPAPDDRDPPTERGR